VEVDSASTTHVRRRNQEKFELLAKQWIEDTRFTASPSEKYLHPCYARIIGMGPDAVPLILAQLKRQPGDWFYALRAITGSDPVSDDMAGRMNAMRDAWLNWGRSRKLIDGAETEAS
jgi:hypothetical protein